MADTDKCAHPPCTCSVQKGSEYGKYCSANCQMKGDIVELRCECGHRGCE